VSNLNLKLSDKQHWLAIFLAVLLIFSLVYALTSNLLQHPSYNFMVKKTSYNKNPSDEIVMIVIDDKSLSELGRWPWKRTLFAEIFEYLENHTNAVVYGFDALIIAPDTENVESDKKFFTEVGKFDRLISGVAFGFDRDGIFEVSQEYADMLFTKTDINFIDKRSKKHLKISNYTSITKFPEEYFKNIQKLGSVNAKQDSDGYIRRLEQVINYEGRMFPSLALAMYSDFTGIKEFVITDNHLTGENENYKLKIPIENSRGAILSYLMYYNTADGVYSHKRVSAADVVQSLRLIKQGKEPILDAGIFDGKAVIVGANANAQALQDVKRTPISDTFAGLGIQATNLNNLLKNEFFVVTSNMYNLFLTIAVFTLVFLLICVLPISAALFATAFAMFAYFIFAFLMYDAKISVPLILPEMFMFLAIAVGYSYRFLLEGRKKEKLQNAMGKYISRDVMHNVMKNLDEVGLGGKKAVVTVLFADIRGFTAISEQFSAEEVTAVLNEYFSVLVPIIEAHNGVLNKFMGDAILAIFGEPIQNENHASDAVRCGDEILKKVKKLQGKWLNEGKPKIEIGIGISTGEVFAGNIGSEERLEYTVIGDTVNIASRIENYNKVYKTKFLISQETFEAVQKQVDVIKIREVTIRGKMKKINIYEVLRLVPH
jgi:adenylate cyclase